MREPGGRSPPWAGRSRLGVDGLLAGAKARGIGGISVTMLASLGIILHA